MFLMMLCPVALGTGIAVENVDIYKKDLWHLIINEG